MTSTLANNVKLVALVALALFLLAAGIYVAAADDPNLTGIGPGGLGMLLMAAGAAFGVRATRNRLPTRARRAALAVSVLIAAVVALLIHAAAVTAPLFAQAQSVPSVSDSAPSPQYAAAIERARERVRAAVLEQNLPGVSVAVGAGGTIVWAEGFGWRDVDSRTPVTPRTRFNIGTAAPVVSAAVASLGMTNTGTDTAAEWSPGHLGEPEDDFPPFTLVHNIILRPLGVSAPAQPLPGERATFYVPRSDDNDPRRGRRLMYMRDLACCANGRAFYSTPSDLVRFALATKTETLSGELAGGSVLSLITGPNNGVVVAVASNVAHAGTSAVAMDVADAFAAQK